MLLARHKLPLVPQHHHSLRHPTPSRQLPLTDFILLLQSAKQHLNLALGFSTHSHSFSLLVVSLLIYYHISDIPVKHFFKKSKSLSRDFFWSGKSGSNAPCVPFFSSPPPPSKIEHQTPHKQPEKDHQNTPKQPFLHKRTFRQNKTRHTKATKNEPQHG